MKKITVVLALCFSVVLTAQSNANLITHYQKVYKAMKAQGDINGIISAMTHLNVLEPSVARTDTLAYLYLSDGRYKQALNTVGIKANPNDSDINVEVKAVALKNLNQPKLALEHFEELFKRKPNVYLAYEIADMKVQINDLNGAESNIAYGMKNLKGDEKRAFYETQQPYETSLKAAFLNLKGLMAFRKDDTKNIDVALGFVNQALAEDPNFNLAKITREALEAKKVQLNQK